VHRFILSVLILFFSANVLGVELRVQPNEANFVNGEHIPALADAKFSSSGQTIIVSDFMGRFFLVSLQTMKVVRLSIVSGTEHSGGWLFDVNPIADEFAVVADPGVVSFYDASTGALNHKCTVKGKGVVLVQFTPSGKTLLANSEGQGIDLIDAQCNIIKPILSDATGTKDMRMTRDEKYLAISTCTPRTVKRSDAHGTVRLFDLTRREAPGSSVQEIWRSVALTAENSIMPFECYAHIQFSPNSTYLILIGPGRPIEILTVKNEPTLTRDMYVSRARRAIISPDGRYVATVQNETGFIPLCPGRLCISYSVQIWKDEHGQLTLKTTIPTTLEATELIDFHPKKKILLRASLSGSSIRLYNVDEGSELLIDIDSLDDVAALTESAWDSTAARASRVYTVNGTQTESVGATGKFKQPGLIKAFLSRAHVWDGISE